MNGKTVGTIILIILFILLIGVVGVGAYVLVGGNPIGDGEQKYWQECTITVKEKLIGADVYIEEVNCLRNGKCGSLFSIFQAEGNIEMWDSTGKIAGKSYETDLFSGKDVVTLRGCTADDDVTIRLYDDDGNVLESYP